MLSPVWWAPSVEDTEAVLHLTPFSPQAIDLGSDELFAWRIRLDLERCLHNIPDGQKAIIEYVAELADAGHPQVSHAAIAAALRRGQRTVREALRRARQLDMIDWRPCYEARPGSVLRWRKANIYRRTMPQAAARPRPDVRRHPRHDGGTLRRAKEEAMNQASGVDLLAARKACFDRPEIWQAIRAPNRCANRLE